MKKLIAILIVLFTIMTLLATSQTVIKKDSTGNFYQVKVTTETSKLTGQTFTNSDGEKFQLYEGKRGGIYYIRTDKNGLPKKQYLKID